MKTLRKPKSRRAPPLSLPSATHTLFRLCLLCPFLILLHFLASPSSSSLSSSLRRHPPPICTLWTPNQVTRTRSLLDLYGKYFYTRQPQPLPLPPPTATPALRQWKSFFLHFCPFFCWLAKCESPWVSLAWLGSEWYFTYSFSKQTFYYFLCFHLPRLLPAASHFFACFSFFWFLPFSTFFGCLNFITLRLSVFLEGERERQREVERETGRDRAAARAEWGRQHAMVLPALCGLSNAVSSLVCGNFCLKWKSFHRLFCVSFDLAPSPCPSLFLREILIVEIIKTLIQQICKEWRQM